MGDQFSFNEFQDPIAGPYVEQPGFWAEMARDYNWRLGQRTGLRKSSKLYQLRKVPLPREPALRVARAGKKFFSPVVKEAAEYRGPAYPVGGGNKSRHRGL